MAPQACSERSNSSSELEPGRCYQCGSRLLPGREDNHSPADMAALLYIADQYD